MIISIRHVPALIGLSATVACGAPDRQRQPVSTDTTAAAGQAEVSQNVAGLTAGILALQAGSANVDC